MVVLVFFVCNIGLTALQYFWGRLVLRGVLKKLGGDDSHKDFDKDH